MPAWFMKQMKKAFLEKNRREVRILNQCWFDYLWKQKNTAGDSKNY
ncbi:cortex morphogenetic protein CmpA [Salibacterium lacus]|uniref:Cortex morphogenetic protein CmpA n=1 Tax=Salibacterium lacus TaxID=1898109 RepID=A0ABW5T1Q3_9BACI